MDLPILRTSERAAFKRTGRPITSQTPSAQRQRCSRARGWAHNYDCVRHAEIGELVPALDWAHVHGESGEDVWADFVPLCRSCHMNYDNSEARWGDPEYRRHLSVVHSTRARARSRDGMGRFT